MSARAFLPFVGLGPLRFGQSRLETRSLMAGEPVSFSKAATTLVDEYKDEGLHLYFDADERLEFIEAFEPAEFVYADIQLLGTSSSAVAEQLICRGIRVVHDDVGYDCPDIGLGCTIEEDVVAGVGIYGRGYDTS